MAAIVQSPRNRFELLRKLQTKESIVLKQPTWDFSRNRQSVDPIQQHIQLAYCPGQPGSDQVPVHCATGCFSPPVRWGLLDFMSVSSSPPPPRPLLLRRPPQLTGILWVQCGVLDPNGNWDPLSSVWRTGPQPRSCEFSVASRTPTAILRIQCGVPDPNRDPVSSVWRAGPQVLCQKICQKEWQKICQKEWQKICQKKCQKDMSEDMSERMSKDMSERCQKECQKICQKECQKICQKEW